ncbi:MULTISPECIES: DoxX family protein [Arenibacter]|uniref:DoxX family protein n=1 Tax=Arenibacter TaxID=178469 RepID=UPI001C07613D|nr:MULTISPECIES: DoxX family protein [Arenibacter]MBU2904923.1 DoxX family protein [Arenibacter algicola]MCK0132749.1 DoxX family protein [Arenibacter sp. S6351L]
MDNVLTYPTELLLLLFLIITFLQSALDKILDWKGNLSWLKSHFSQTPFKNMVPLLLGTVMVTEIVAGILCTVGFYLLMAQGDGSIALAGAILACLALLMLLLGQRMAKDYDGARTIAIYFMPAIFLVFLLHS